MNRLLPVIIIVLLLLVVGLGHSLAFKNPPKRTITVGGATFKVEIADTDEKKARGLSGRKSLAENSGMLFVFRQDSTPAFWMKDMLIPIDIIWINDGKVAQINEDVPPPTPGTIDSNLKLYTPKEPIDYVLELKAGVSKKRSIRVNDPVVLDQQN